MKRIFSIIFLLFLCFHTSLMAQRTMNTLNNQFGSSANGLDRDQYDRNGNPIDTTAVVDASLGRLSPYFQEYARHEIASLANADGELPQAAVILQDVLERLLNEIPQISDE